MAIDAIVIENLIKEAFPDAEVKVDGADGVHMSAIVASSQFAGKSMIAQHRMVFAALKGKMDGSNGELHAPRINNKSTKPYIWTRTTWPNSSNKQQEINETVKSNNVVLFMKGTKAAPQCGFSNKVSGILNYMGVDFKDINVLGDESIREGIKIYSDWPTVPQLYVNGEFVGGCDIITEMTLSGELDTLLEEQKIPYDKEAADKIRATNS